MEKALVGKDQAVLTNNESAEVLQPSKGAFYFPSFPITPKSTSVLFFGTFSSLAMRADQFDATRGQVSAEFTRVVSAIGNNPEWFISRTPFAGSGNRDLCQSAGSQFYFRGRCRGNLASERNTLAVDHHHPLCTFAAFGFSHAEPPFLAEAKLPSKNTSLQFNRPCSSSSFRKYRQILNHTP